MVDWKYILNRATRAFAEVLWPTRCVGCDLPATLLCAACAAELPYIQQSLACPRCAAPYGHLLCTECLPAGSIDRHEQVLNAPFLFSSARAALSYEGMAQKIIKAYKDGGEYRLAPVIASCICRALRGDVDVRYNPLSFSVPNDGFTENWATWADALVSIPSSPGSLRKRGFDHMDRVGLLCSQWMGIPQLHPLCSRTVLDQRGLSDAERLHNRIDSFKAIDAASAIPERILLIDDVLTTGATAQAATHALLELGASEVRLAVFARVW